MNIQESIQYLEQLFMKLSVDTPENQEYDIPDQTEQVVIDYSSEEENPFENPCFPEIKEGGGTSAGPRWRVPPEPRNEYDRKTPYKYGWVPGDNNAWFKPEREAKVSLCCARQAGQIGNYGCEPKRKYKKRFNSKPFKKKNPVNNRKQFKEAFKKKNLFRNRKQFKNKRKFCPQNKKNCKCWLCDETGHYANECSKSSNYKDKREILKLLWTEGFEPVEDKKHEPLEDVTYVIITSDSESETSSESDTDDEEAPF